MKYQRLVLRQADKTSGTFAEPSFRVNLSTPFDRPTKIFLEGAYINAKMSSTKNDAYVRITLQNSFAGNSQTSKNGGFTSDGVLGRVSFDFADSTASPNTILTFNRDAQYNDNNGNLLYFPNSVFHNGILNLSLTFGEEDDAPIITTGSTILDNYTIVLGIYQDEEDISFM